jgi:hypothetical protein
MTILPNNDAWHERGHERGIWNFVLREAWSGLTLDQKLWFDQIIRYCIKELTLPLKPKVLLLDISSITKLTANSSTITYQKPKALSYILFFHWNFQQTIIIMQLSNLFTSLSICIMATMVLASPAVVRDADELVKRQTQCVGGTLECYEYSPYGDDLWVACGTC